jgi:hypothetical protein
MDIGVDNRPPGRVGNAEDGLIHDITFLQQRHILGSQPRKKLITQLTGKRGMKLLPHFAFEIRVHSWKGR